MPAGPVVILTQEEPDNTRLSGLLNGCGLAAVSYPCIATEYIEFDPAAVIAGRGIADFGVVVFTSRRGAHGFKAARDVLARSKPLVACVGEGTAQAVEDAIGLNCDILPEGDRTGAQLAQAIITRAGEPRPLLHVRGTKTTGTLKTELERHGWIVDELTVYRSFPPDTRPITIAGPAIGVFASPSAVKHFFAVNRHYIETLPCVAIGPVTGDYLRRAGVTDITEAGRPDPASVVAAIDDLSRRIST